MPVYAFACEGCGGFELPRPVAEAGASARCPACGAPARRVFTPPGLARIAAPLRGALETEERSAHEPDVVALPRGRPFPHAHAPSPPWTLAH